VPGISAVDDDPPEVRPVCPGDGPRVAFPDDAFRKAFRRQGAFTTVKQQGACLNDICAFLETLVMP